jgi:hypothetical protein
VIELWRLTGIVHSEIGPRRDIERKTSDRPRAFLLIAAARKLLLDR